MALRSIDQRFFTDPYVESLNKTEKLLYIYLFSSVHTNLIGVIEATPRLMAYETDSTEAEIRAALDRFERDGKVVSDGGVVWRASHIRHQCTSSPKMLVAMRAHLARVESGVIRRAICDRYPHILEGVRRPLPAAVQYRIDTVSVPSRYGDQEREKISACAAPVEGAPAKTPETLAVTDELARMLRHDFPAVDLEREIQRARVWCSLRGQAVRNVCRFLRAWFANAAKRMEKLAPCAREETDSRPASRRTNAAGKERATVRNAAPCEPFRMPTPEELDASHRIGFEIMAKWNARNLSEVTA